MVRQRLFAAESALTSPFVRPFVRSASTVIFGEFSRLTSRAACSQLHHSYRRPRRSARARSPGTRGGCDSLRAFLASPVPSPPSRTLTSLPTLVQETVRKWLSELELAFFDELERALPHEELARLRSYLGTDGSHVAHALAKYAAQAGGGYRRRMIYGV